MGIGMHCVEILMAWAVGYTVHGRVEGGQLVQGSEVPSRRVGAHVAHQASRGLSMTYCESLLLGAICSFHQLL